MFRSEKTDSLLILVPANSMAVLLLPTAAEAQSDGNESRIAQTIAGSLRYSLYMGILCIGVFTLFGAELGIGVFKDPSAGTFMQILAWLCPFLYLATTMGSILNGLGKTVTTFLQNVAALHIGVLCACYGGLLAVFHLARRTGSPKKFSDSLTKNLCESFVYEYHGDFSQIILLPSSTVHSAVTKYTKHVGIKKREELKT